MAYTMMPIVEMANITMLTGIGMLMHNTVEAINCSETVRVVRGRPSSRNGAHANLYRDCALRFAPGTNIRNGTMNGCRSSPRSSAVSLIRYFWYIHASFGFYTTFDPKTQEMDQIT